MQRILVPTDFSNNAYAALLYATRLFQDQKCKIYILNTFDVNTPVLTSRMNTERGKILYQKLSNASKEKLEESLHRIIRDTEHLNHSFETISVSKDLTETINKTVTHKNIDLIVMGTKGATSAKEMFMGSNTVKVIRKNKNCPVLIVPDEFDFCKPKEIAFATGLRRSYHENEIIPMITIAKVFESKIRIFHIHKEEELDSQQKHSLKALKQHLKNFEISMHYLHKDAKKAFHIQEFIKQKNINMLFMIRYRHSVLEEFTKEAVIKKIGFAPTIPFLVIPELN
ncbi:universal stress protein [Aquimarina sp. 2201CG1-2-11]|uniref:universal stress protein n=1 Tax=Aquimarina discodermiae TaxID=3231043 RepID=UPI0034618BC9